jgi:hypothetical protein
MQRCAGMLMALLVAVFATQAAAHHSFDTMYREDQRITIAGELAQIHFRNPHSMVHLIVKGRTGREVRYLIEWAAAGDLKDRGVTSQTLKIGDYVVVTGSPARFGDNRLRLVTLHRPKDNYSFDGKNSGM